MGFSLAFDRQCLAIGLASPVAEYVFARPRRWRFDWAFLEVLVAVEVEGGSWIPGGGRHTRGKGFENDLVKYAEALCRGWRVLRVTPQMVDDGRALGYLERVMKGDRCPKDYSTR